MNNNRIYKFKYVPLTDQPVVVRYIDVSQVIAVGMFEDHGIIGIQVDVKTRDAPLVIEVMTESHLVTQEMEKMKVEMERLVEAVSFYLNRAH